MARKQKPMSVKVRAYIAKHPNASAKEVATHTGAKEAYVYTIKSTMKSKTKQLPVERVKAGGYEYEEQNGVWKNVAGKGTFGEIKLSDEDESWKTVYITTSGQAILAGGPTEAELNGTADNVNHPAHYKKGGIETIDFLKAKLTPEEFRGYLKGNVLKYLSRANEKGNYEEDMLKARWYLNREIAEFTKE